jgi:hypothetical protein
MVQNDPLIMPNRLEKIFGKEFYHGILGYDTAEANVEFAHYARRRLVKLDQEWYAGMYLTELGMDELCEEGRLPLFISVATRTSAKYKKGEVSNLLKFACRNAVYQLHQHGIEAEWSGSVNSPVYVDGQLDIEESTYEAGTRVFQDWYKESVFDSGRGRGESDAVTSLLIEILQKLAMVGLDPWMLDMQWITEKFGLGEDDVITEKHARMMLADIEKGKYIG